MGPLTAGTLGGFISGTFTLSGVLLAYALGQRRARAETVTEARRAGMAVLVELVHNADLALGAMDTGVIHEFSNSAWREQVQVLARIFDWGTLRSIESAYESARRLYDVCHEASRGPKAIDTGDAEQIATCGGVAEKLLKSAREICPLLLSPNEQAVFNGDLDAMLKRAGAAHSSQH
ncbi:MAG TPA: hypothetical protein VMH37_02635 [Candidatus Binataceae bacterium]|nr:hypothetical protein [Candidatus Binataceae bacterium]